jgi:SAM-dependent methyltransferase
MTLAVQAVADVLAPHLPIYRVRKPVYQTVMLESLRQLWRPEFRRVLDVGGGTGVIAQAIKELFAVDRVLSVDVEDRFLDSLTIETLTYDGRQLPFEADQFDCVLFNNVLHHVRPDDRLPLLLDCRRVAANGSLLIKDHLATSSIDHLRLGALDFIGNVPFSGMVKADYLERSDWDVLAQASGYEIETAPPARYRSPIFAAAFPNRLEITMRWRPVP